MPDVMHTNELCEKLNLIKHTDRVWHLQPCCATEGVGLLEGLDFLVHALEGL
jgi:ADP-ribosylation factor protein 5